MSHSIFEHILSKTMLFYTYYSAALHLNALQAITAISYDTRAPIMSKREARMLQLREETFLLPSIARQVEYEEEVEGRTGPRKKRRSSRVAVLDESVQRSRSPETPLQSNAKAESLEKVLSAKSRKRKREVPIDKQTLDANLDSDGILSPTAQEIYRISSSSSSNETMDTQDLVCECEHGVSEDRDDYFMCTRCAKLQHFGCSLPDDSSKGMAERYRCNKCEATELEHIITTRQEQIQKARNVIAQKRAENEGLLMEVLWRHYCLLPNGSASEDVIQATRTTFEGGRSIPLYKAPEEWIHAIQKNVEDMMHAAGKKVTDFVILPTHSAMEMNESILKPWRDIALWLVHRGPYKGRRRELGVLAEVLGLEEKGTIWKG